MRQIGFKNFRKFANHATIDFGNINLLVGGNNSGKSTVVKALLLITENLRILTEDSYNYLNMREENGENRKREFHPEFNFAPNILHDALHIGTFERAINNESESNEMQLSIVYGDIYKVTITIGRNVSPELPTAPIKQILIEDFHADITISLNYDEQVADIYFKHDLNNSERLKNILRHTNVKWKGFEELITEPLSVEKIDTILEKIGEYKSIKQQDSEMERPSIFYIVDNEDYHMLEREIKLAKRELVLGSNLDFSNGITVREKFNKSRILLPFLNNDYRIGRYFRDLDMSEEDEEQTPLDDYHKYLYSKFRYFRNLTFSLTRCIQEPNTEYLYAHAVNQNTLYRINSQNDYMSNTIQEYFCSNIKKGDEEYKFIQKWMDAFNIASDFVVSPVAGCEAYTVKIGKVGTSQKKWMNLAEKGMGSIQMMILLFKIATLIRKYKSIGRPTRIEFMPVILIEEPEQNLHPSLQSKLADLFFEINDKYKIRFIVETHSEYLVRKAQVLVGDMACSTQEETDEKNPFKVFYFPSNGVPYDMGMAPTGKFLNLFDEGFFDVAAKLNMEVIRRERKK